MDVLIVPVAPAIGVLSLDALICIFIVLRMRSWSFNRSIKKQNQLNNKRIFNKSPLGSECKNCGAWTEPATDLAGLPRVSRYCHDCDPTLVYFLVIVGIALLGCLVFSVFKQTASIERASVNSNLSQEETISQEIDFRTELQEMEGGSAREDLSIDGETYVQDSAGTTLRSGEIAKLFPIVLCVVKRDSFQPKEMDDSRASPVKQLPPLPGASYPRNWAVAQIAFLDDSGNYGFFTQQVEMFGDWERKNQDCSQLFFYASLYQSQRERASKEPEAKGTIPSSRLEDLVYAIRQAHLTDLPQTTSQRLIPFPFAIAEESRATSKACTKELSSVLHAYLGLGSRSDFESTRRELDSTKREIAERILALRRAARRDSTLNEIRSEVDKAMANYSSDLSDRLQSTEPTKVKFLVESLRKEVESDLDGVWMSAQEKFEAHRELGLPQEYVMLHVGSKCIYSVNGASSLSSEEAISSEDDSVHNFYRVVRDVLELVPYSASDVSIEDYHRVKSINLNN